MLMFVPELPLPGIVLAAAGRTVTVAKPDAGTPVVYRLEPGDTLNLQPIANDSITLVKLGNRLVVLFPDRGFMVLDGLYLTDGSPSPDVNINFAPGTTLTAVQFSAQFPITTDTEILTAAGINVGPLGSGGINLAAAPPGSSLQPIGDLTPGVEINGAQFGLLPASTFTGTDGGFGTTPPNLPTTLDTLAAANDSGSVSEAGVQPGNAPFAGTSSVTGSVLANDTGTAPITLVGIQLGAVSSATGNLGTPIAGTYGTVTLAANGTYTYVLDNADLDTNALAQGQSVQEIFTYTVQDSFGQFSTAQLVITVVGTNDAPVITEATEFVPDEPFFPEGEAPASASTLFGTVVEAGSGGGGTTPGIPVATGRIVATDVDNGAVLAWSGNARGVYGDFTIDPTTGQWTYTLDNSDPDTQALVAGQLVREQFTVTVTDEFGATDTTTVSINVFGANDTGGVEGRLDLDTTNPGVDYRGLSEVEAARSTSKPAIDDGVTIVQTDDGKVPVFQYTADGPGALSISAEIQATTIGERGYLTLVDRIGFLSGGGSLSFIAGSAGTAFEFDGQQIVGSPFVGGGLTQTQVDQFIQNLRYVNTETTFALDTSDREIVVTLVDANGVTQTATAYIPVVADVADTTGLNAFTGTRFSDRILGLDGDDIIDGGEGDNVIDGGTGDNEVKVGNGSNLIEAAEGDDLVTAGDGDNLINAGDGDNVINVGDGKNVIAVGTGDDRITTGNGDNTISAGDGGNTVTTGSGDDVVITGDGDNIISVGAGNDEVITGAGDDRISLGAGDDRVTTGSAADTIVFDTPLAEIGRDTIVDFESGFDTMELDFSVFGTGLAVGGADTGTLDNSRFVSGAGFTDTTQRFLFDTTSNTLFFDADGAGAGASIELAKLESGGTVAATDIRLA
ncbi:MAG: hypothetical protein CTY25_03695 [Methylobacterium sp.]|nr:MAG: hypothetical protein CTY25_03695 [Methylobacterium sp.]